MLSEKKKRVFKSNLANLSGSRDGSKDSGKNSPFGSKKMPKLFENRGNEYCLTMMDSSSPLRNPRLKHRGIDHLNDTADHMYLNMTLNDSKENHNKEREKRSSQKIRSVSRPNIKISKKKKKKLVLEKPKMTENSKRILMSIENIRLNLDIAIGTLDGVEFATNVNKSIKGFSSSKKPKSSKSKKMEITEEEINQTKVVEAPKTNPAAGNSYVKDYG